MAKKLKHTENGEKDAPVKVASLANFKGFDGEQLKADLTEIIGLADKAKEDSQPVKDKKAELKAERGYNMKAFGTCIQMERAETLEARDMWLTIKAYAEAKGLDNPDLVDKMMEDA